MDAYCFWFVGDPLSDISSDEELAARLQDFALVGCWNVRGGIYSQLDGDDGGDGA
ncbi:hypothetical protein GCM10007416_20490 [Kroppenstedtia guangzhouensis]|uniref:Uncharacterized protein n=1 Tax=Kroppenstedtia guangzhouensis TaxID=1274356 RepID=A0ABQ1GNZ9_9BACL|nr:hypothetical protein GCM10007416_20490 [Kroppenstedtia guangzhouensis]